MSDGIQFLKTRSDLFSILPPSTVGAEIGVQRGDFSEAILTHPVSKLYLVDCWKQQHSTDYELDSANVADCHQETLYRFVVERFKPFGSRVSILRGNSLDVCCGFEDGSLDWVYLDADHTYGGIWSDLNSWSRKVRTGGYVFGHDYCINGRTIMCKYGVYDAVNRFCQEFGWSIQYLTDEEWTSYAIRKI